MYLVLTCLIFVLLFLPFLKKTSFGYKTIFTSLAIFYYDFVELVLGPFLVKKYFSFFFLLFIFIFLANILGLVPFFHPITGNINVTVGLSLIVFVFYHYEGVKELGIKKYLAHFMGPGWYLAFLFIPLEILSHGLRPITLGLRLRTNIYADHVIYSAFSELVPYVIPVFFLFQGLFVSFIQALVFTLLGMVYINLATSHE